MSEYIKRIRETEQRKLQAEIQKVLDYELAPETIDQYTQEVLGQLQAIIAHAVNQYALMEPSSKNFQGKELEDAAFSYFNISDIQIILDQLAQKQLILDRVVACIAQIDTTGEVITPPDLRSPQFDEGEVEFQKARMLERLKIVLYIIENDCNVPLEKVLLLEGTITEEMFREHPYYRIEVDALDRIIYICDEDRNASYFFSQEEVASLGIRVEELDALTKEEKNRLISEHLGCGVRLVYQKRWKEKVLEFLTESLPGVIKAKKKRSHKDEQIRPTDVPPVSRIELDPWKGFWTDDQERHWGTSFSVAQRLNVDRKFLLRWISDHSLVTRSLWAGSGGIRPGHCYEEIISHPKADSLFAHTLGIAENDVEKQFVESGEGWPLFHTGPDNKHYGSCEAIGLKLGCNPKKVRKIAKAHSDEVLGVLFKEARGDVQKYAYEDILSLPEVAEVMSHPRAAFEGEWAGFYSESEYKHWGIAPQIAQRLGLTVYRVQDCIKTAELVEKKIVSLKFEVKPGYCYEDVLALATIQNYLREKEEQPALQSFNDPEWPGFRIDQEERHFGTIAALAKKIGCAYSVAEGYINSGELQAVTYGLAGKEYCYEELIALPELAEILSHPKVALEGEWADFYTDDKEKHWAVTRALSKQIGASETLIRKWIAENNLKMQHIVSIRFYLSNGYCLEDLLDLPEVQTYLVNKK